MEVGIVGLPSVGKTTLFNALTGSHVEGFDAKSHVGVANIPDPRLDVIAGFITTRKIVHATLRLVDIPGVPVGSDPKKLNQFLEHLRQIDGICHVVRCFDDGSGSIDPAGDIEAMDTELVLADLLVAESAKEKAAKGVRGQDPEAKARMAVLDRVAPILEEGRPIRVVLDEFSDAERRILTSYGFITAKPVLYVANIAEDAITDGSPEAERVAELAREFGSTAISVCATLEAELVELEDSDQTEMLESLGLDEPAVGPLARGAQAVLGLSTFYTAGDKEVRAWNVPIGAPAQQAAGVIHSDIERGFIRAECYSITDLEQFKSEKAIRDAGRLRSEGKQDQLQDGDIVHFLFNV